MTFPLMDNTAKSMNEMEKRDWNKMQKMLNTCAV